MSGVVGVGFVSLLGRGINDLWCEQNGILLPAMIVTFFHVNVGEVMVASLVLEETGFHDRNGLMPMESEWDPKWE